MNEAIHKAKEQQKHDWQTGKAAMNEAIRHAKFESKHNKDAAVQAALKANKKNNASAYWAHSMEMQVQAAEDAKAQESYQANVGFREG